MSEKHVLVICHDRSGSNLLKGMLNTHPDIFIIPPLPIFEIIYHYRDLYGALNHEPNWTALLDDIKKLFDVNHHTMPYEVSMDELRESAATVNRSLGGAVQALFSVLYRKSEKQIVGLKFAAQLTMLEDFVNSSDFNLAIFQYRDPRDVVLSAYKSGTNNNIPEGIAAYWIKWHREVRRVIKNAKIPILEQSYEELLREPESTMNNIWTFLDIKRNNDYMDFYKNDMQVEAASKSYMWENVAKPLMRDNMEKFYKEFSPQKVKSIEKSIGKDGLAEFGYEPSKLRKFSVASLFAKPKPRKRTVKDREFQKQQNEVRDSIIKRYHLAKDDGRI